MSIKLSEIVSLTKDEIKEILYWIEFGAKNHIDQSARNSARILLKTLEDRILEKVN